MATLDLAHAILQVYYHALLLAHERYEESPHMVYKRETKLDVLC